MQKIIVSTPNLKWYFIFVAITTLIISTGLYFVLGSGARMALIEQMKQREVAVAKSGAQSISAFIHLFGNSLILLATNPNITLHDTKAQISLDNFVENWKNTPFNGVTLIDKEGKSILISSKTGATNTSTPVFVDDRDYFTWAKSAKKGELYVGSPIFPKVGNLSNQYIIPIATPIYHENNFNGVLVSSIVLSQLTDTYLDPLKISPQTQIYLLDETGAILYAPNEKIIGKNYLTYLDERQFPVKSATMSLLESKFETTQSGTLDLILPNLLDSSLTRFLIAYAPISYDDTHLTLAIAIPANEALAFIAPIYINQLGILLAGFFSVLLLTVVFIKFKTNRSPNS